MMISSNVKTAILQKPIYKTLSKFKQVFFKETENLIIHLYISKMDLEISNQLLKRRTKLEEHDLVSTV